MFNWREWARLLTPAALYDLNFWRTIVIIVRHRTIERSTIEMTAFHNYKGLGLQFAALGSIIWREAVERGLGLEVEDHYFTQSVHP